MSVGNAPFSGPVFVFQTQAFINFRGVFLIKNFPATCFWGHTGCYCNGYINNERILAMTRLKI